MKECSARELRREELTLASCWVITPLELPLIDAINRRQRIVNYVNNGEARRTWLLLGDPTMKVK